MVWMEGLCRRAREELSQHLRVRAGIDDEELEGWRQGATVEYEERKWLVILRTEGDPEAFRAELQTPWFKLKPVPSELDVLAMEGILVCLALATPPE